MSAYQLTIATPDGNLFDGMVHALYLRGAEGDLAILSGHTPFVTTVQKGECRVEFEDASEKRGYIDGGMLNVSGEGVILLSATFKWL